MTPKISLKSVHKSFGAKPVLQGISLDVPKGDSLVVIGGSGTGKSVLLKCILGLIKPDAGTIEIDGKTTHSLDSIGMLFQGGALFDSMPIWQNVAFRLLQTKLPRHKAREIAIEKLRRVGLSPDTADLYPSELSGGMQKRAALARAIAADPDILFFDEPTTGLDPIMSGVINDLIREIVSEMGATTLTITHDMTSVRAIATQVAMLHAGHIRWHGPVADIDTADDPYLRQFIGGHPTGPIETLR